jgi:LCP family protein required for cell wall assembly
MDIDGMRPANRRPMQRSLDGVRMAPVRPRVNTHTSTTNTRPTLARRPTYTPANEVKAFPLPKYYAPERPTKLVRKKTTKKMLALRVGSGLLVLVLATGGFFSWKAYNKFHKVFRGTNTVAALSSKPVTPSLLKGEGDGRVNILLLGIGGPGHDGPDLTDTIVVLSVDPVNNTASMLSIPRDLWVQQPVNYFGKQQKINAAYESGKYHYLGKLDPSSANASAVEAGFNSIDQVVKNVLNVNVNYHVLVNFQAFRQAIDTVGGVTVDVKEPLVDPTMAWENHWNATLAPAGVQQMDGVKALLYARSRETSSDFARSQRQRQILVALKDKVLTADTLSNPAKIDALMNAFGDNVYSDLSTQGATRLYGIMKKVSDTKINSIGLTDEPHKLVTTDHIGTTSVVRPIAGFDNYADIQAYVLGQLPDGYLIKEKAPVAVIGKTVTGATAVATLLKNYGYSVVSTSSTDQAVSGPVVADLSHGKNPYTLHYLESRYGVKAVSVLPSGVATPTSAAKFVIIEPK